MTYRVVRLSSPLNAPFGIEVMRFELRILRFELITNVAKQQQQQNETMQETYRTFNLASPVNAFGVMDVMALFGKYLCTEQTILDERRVIFYTRIAHRYVRLPSPVNDSFAMIVMLLAVRSLKKAHVEA
jgi:hypothetical protein